jgi:ubiquinone biosynthesis protein
MVRRVPIRRRLPPGDASTREASRSDPASSFTSDDGADAIQDAWKLPPLPDVSEAKRPEDIYRHIPRRPLFAKAEGASLAPTMISEVRFSASIFHVIGRLFMWLLGLMLFLLRMFGDIVRMRPDWRKRRWVRLRQSFEFLGGTFIKVGQQLSLRVDLLPIELCDELGKLLDQVPAFPTAIAQRRIEKAIGGPLHETFKLFDPVPIGSASVSCVYQAVLQNGERVAIKVRRPRIGAIFAADLRAIGLVFWLLELLTVVREDFFKNLRTDLSTMLLEELDFRVEARNQELFRRATRKARLNYMHAPRVYCQYSTEDVLVSEYISGIFLSELLAAIESSDTTTLERIRKLGVNPKRVAYRLMAASLFSVYDGSIFHADPHPANIVVQPNNHLMLIDFGSCGAYTDRERTLLRQLQYHMLRLEPSAMVQVVLAMQEPLPPVDISLLSKKLEMAWWGHLRALRSKHAEWWERTSAGLWLHIMQVTREFNIPINLGMLKGIRSTMLYDTVAARLNPQINALKVMTRYYKNWQQRRRKLAAKRLRRRAARFDLGKTLVDGYIALEGATDLFAQGTFQLRRLFDAQPLHFTEQVAKASFLGLTVIKMYLSIALVTSLSWAGVMVHRHMALKPMEAWDALTMLIRSRSYWLLIGIFVFRAARQVQFRFADKDRS